jgi:hypothetical protein
MTSVADPGSCVFFLPPGPGSEMSYLFDFKDFFLKPDTGTLGSMKKEVFTFHLSFV